jgi:hypothetical protein
MIGTVIVAHLAFIVVKRSGSGWFLPKLSGAENLPMPPRAVIVKGWSRYDSNGNFI